MYRIEKFEKLENVGDNLNFQDFIFYVHTFFCVKFVRPNFQKLFSIFGFLHLNKSFVEQREYCTLNSQAIKLEKMHF